MEFMSQAELYKNPLFFSLVLLLFSLIVWLKLQANGQKKLNLPPSPPKLPIIGNIHQLGKLPNQSLRDLATKYGSLLLLQLGRKPTLVVSSADMVKEIATHHDVAFSSRPSTTATNIMLYGCSDIAFSPYGDYWRQVRKICVVEILSLRRIHSFQYVREEEVEVAMEKLRKASSNGEVVSMTGLLMAFSNNVVSRSALSRRIVDQEDGESKFGSLARRLETLLGSFCVGDMFPYLKWIDVLRGFITSLEEVIQQLDMFFDDVLEEHKDTKNNGDKDFVSILLQLQEHGKLGMDLTRDNIKAIILDMFVGGTDTTSTMLEWIMSELMKNPNVMQKLQKNIRDVVGNKAKVEMNDVNQMDYLKCVLKETLRLHPAVPLLVPRQTTSKVNLGGYEIPSDVTVLVNTWAIQRDPKLWEKPEEFIPERFEKSSVDYNGQDFEFIPFGFGRRRCPGIAFAMASMNYAMANLLYWFDWKLADDENAEKLDMDELYGLVVSKKVPLRVLPIFRGQTD